MPALADHVCKKSPAAKATGESVQTGIRQEKAAHIQPTIRSTEYRCYIKEVIPICNSGCGNLIVEKSFVHRTTPRSGGT